MKTRSAMLPLTVVLTTVALIGLAPQAKGDTVQLVNGDVLRGKVVSLNDTQLVFRSESFGEIKVERSKVDLIALGTKGLPSARQASAPSASAPSANAGVGSLLNGVSPILGNHAGQKNLDPMVEQLLGAGGVGDLQKNVDTARRGLQDLKKDMGSGPEGQAIDAYINMLNQFGALSSLAGQQAGPSTPKPPVPRVNTPDAVKKPPAGNKTPANQKTTP
jgi:hypothetical protein